MGKWLDMAVNVDKEQKQIVVSSEAKVDAIIKHAGMAQLRWLRDGLSVYSQSKIESDPVRPRMTHC